VVKTTTAGLDTSGKPLLTRWPTFCQAPSLEGSQVIAEKVSAAATYGGSGAAVYFGFTAGEWQVIGVIGGLVVAVIGLVVNAIYRHAHYKLARDRLEAPDAD
jgi:hypothetical protein